MSNICAEEIKPENVASIIENIPTSNIDGIPVENLCPASSNDSEKCIGCILSLVRVLQAFDVISVTNIDSKQRIKAKSQTATYFLKSLSKYIRNNLKIVSNWEREGVMENISPIHVLTSGAQFVYLMEQKRISEYNNLEPTRFVSVSQLIIKDKVRSTGETVFLFQFDQAARQYQLIGGRKRPTDNDLSETMIREIDEELAPNHFVYDKDYNLIELIHEIRESSLSHTYGAYTQYSFTIYQFKTNRTEIKLAPHDKWVTLSEWRKGKTKDGTKVSGNFILKELEKSNLIQSIPCFNAKADKGSDNVSGSPKEDIIELKPNLAGVGVNLNALWRWLKKKLGMLNIL